MRDIARERVPSLARPEVHGDSEFDQALGGAQLLEGWTIGDAVNGGFAMARLAAGLRPLLDEDGGHPDCLALSAYFLSAARPGQYAVEPQIVRVGRTMSTGQVSLWQEHHGERVERIRALATFGDLSAMSHPLRRQADPPTMPLPDQCLGVNDVPDGAAVPFPPLMDRVELRLDPVTAMWGIGQPSQEGRMRGWIRFRDGREPDALSLLFFLDALPPVASTSVCWGGPRRSSSAVTSEPSRRWDGFRSSLRPTTSAALSSRRTPGSGQHRASRRPVPAARRRPDPEILMRLLDALARILAARMSP